MPSPTPSTQVRNDVWLYFSRVLSILGGQFAIAGKEVRVRMNPNHLPFDSSLRFGWILIQ